MWLLLSILSLALVTFNHESQSEAYIYPVESATDNLIYYVQQKTLSDLELWQYYVATGAVNKQLYWRFMPIGFKLLPDNSGFSFIDTDRLRIKKFLKRSVSTVEFNLPVYSLSKVLWLNEYVCYFSAKQKDRYAIFIGNILTSQLNLLHNSQQADCLCPQIIGNKFFCIERNTLNRSCEIIELNAKKPIDNLKNPSTLPFFDKKKVILDCHYQQIIYLELLSDNLGFYIEHMPYINENSRMIEFVCYKISYSPEADQWEFKAVFKFNIPKKFLIGSSRLCESYLPFLPRAKKTVLYFANIQQKPDGQYYSSIKQFDLISSKKTRILKSEPNQIIFSPILCNNQLFCGQVLANCNDLSNQANLIKVN